MERYIHRDGTGNVVKRDGTVPLSLGGRSPHGGRFPTTEVGRGVIVTNRDWSAEQSSPHGVHAESLILRFRSSDRRAWAISPTKPINRRRFIMGIQILTCSVPEHATLWVANAFSPSMLDGSRFLTFRLLPNEGAAAEILRDICLWRGDFAPVSAVGHPDTAALFSNLLGVEVPPNRISLLMGRWDVILVGQYNGPRLPEGCTTLPEGATIRWWLVFSMGDYPQLT